MALGFRMILVTLVGLYTSRVILEAMGVKDFGIYGVIGGVVGLAGFLNTSMAGATSRFITFELGTGNAEELRKIFSTSLIIHFALALFVLLLAETVGLWFVNCRMNFPPDRMVAVNVLYQFTILTMMVNFTQVPFSACIIAHEKMNIYAYVEILNSCLKLGAVYLVLALKSDRLILYGVLVFCIATLAAMIYRIYCFKKFPESRGKIRYDKTVMKKLVAFSGFDLYGNMCGAVRYQGLPLILNLFFGVVANAGSTIATSVSTAVKGLTSSVAQAFRPQIIKQYAAKEIGEMTQMMLRSNQFTLLAFALVAIPVFFEAPSVLEIWLGQIPEYSVIFLRLVLIAAFIEITIDVNNAGIHATGYIKYISFISGTVYLLIPVVSYLLLKFYAMPAATIYYVNIILMGVVAILGLVFLKIQIRDFGLFKYSVGIFRTIVSVGIAAACVALIRKYGNIESEFSNLFYQLFDIVKVVLISLLALAFSAILITFGKGERRKIFSMISSKLRHC